MSKAMGTAAVSGTALAERETNPMGTGSMSCPSWCTGDAQLGYGITLHTGQRAVIEVAATEATEEHDLVLCAERIDRPGEVGPTVVTLTVDGATTVELPPADLDELLRLGAVIAGQIARYPMKRDDAS